MAALAWSDKFSVGIRAIDEDHKALFDVVNSLHNRVERGSDSREIQSALEALQRYVAEHFAREENFMRECGYPGFKNHVAQHHRLSAALEKIATAYRLAPQKVEMNDILAFTRQWLTNHVLKSDQAYAPFLRGEECSARVVERAVGKWSATLDVPSQHLGTLLRCMEVLEEGGKTAEQLRRLIEKDEAKTSRAS